MMGISNFAPKPVRNDILYPKLFDATMKLFLHTDINNKNRIVILREHLIKTATVGVKTEIDNVKYLVEWFNGTHEKLKHVELLLNNKWSIVLKLYRYKKLDTHQKNEFFNKVAELDKSDTMKSNQITTQAMIASPEEMKKLWESFFDEATTESVQSIGDKMSGFNLSIHENELENYHNLFFEKILSVFKTRSRDYSREFYECLFPAEDSLKKYLENTKELIAKTPEGEEWLKKILKESYDDLERRIKCHECLLGYLEKH